MADNATVHIIDDDEGVRNSLDLLLRSAGYDTCLYASLEDFSPAQAASRLGCILLDVRMPGANGLDFQEEMLRQGTLLSIIMMTGFGDIPMSVRAMKAGAMDFLPKPFEPDQLLAAVAHAVERDQERMALTTSSLDLQTRFASLTQRERQVMALATAGRMNKQAAFELGLSEITVKVHRRSAMIKMKAKTLADLVRMAQALNLTPEAVLKSAM